MSEFLKGNFEPKHPVKKKEGDEKQQLNEEFERTALKRLGGSIAFVTRKGFVWNGEQNEQDGSGETAGE